VPSLILDFSENYLRHTFSVWLTMSADDTADSLMNP